MGRVATMVGQENAELLKKTGDLQVAMKKELSIDDFATMLDVGSISGMKAGKNFDQNDITGFSARTRDVAEMLLRNEPPKEMRMAITPMASA